MTDTNEPLDDIDRAIMISEQPWVGYAQSVLMFMGLMNGLSAIFLAIILRSALSPSMGVTVATVVAVVVFITSEGFALLHLIAASGLPKGRKWAWVISVLLGTLLTVSACMPLGAVVVYGLVKEDSRKAFWS